MVPSADQLVPHAGLEAADPQLLAAAVGELAGLLDELAQLHQLGTVDRQVGAAEQDDVRLAGGERGEQGAEVHLLALDRDGDRQVVPVAARVLAVLQGDVHDRRDVRQPVVRTRTGDLDVDTAGDQRRDDVLAQHDSGVAVDARRGCRGHPAGGVGGDREPLRRHEGADEVGLGGAVAERVDARPPGRADGPAVDLVGEPPGDVGRQPVVVDRHRQLGRDDLGDLDPRVDPHRAHRPLQARVEVAQELGGVGFGHPHPALGADQGAQRLVERLVEGRQPQLARAVVVPDRDPVRRLTDQHRPVVGQRFVDRVVGHAGRHQQTTQLAGAQVDADAHR